MFQDNRRRYEVGTLNKLVSQVAHNVTKRIVIRDSKGSGVVI